MSRPATIWHSFIFRILGYFRRRRGKFLLAQFPDIQTFSICDLGGSEHFWDEVEIGVSRKKVTIFNISTDETQALHNINREHTQFVLYDGHTVPTQNEAFDLCICNSVIEHVAPDQREEFAREVMRIGQRIFVQTPAFEFPFEPHFLLPFLHWLPRSLGYWLACVSPWRMLSRPSLATARSYYFGTRLLTKNELSKLFPGCSILSERFVFFAKSYYVIRHPVRSEPGLQIEDTRSSADDHLTAHAGGRAFGN